MRLASFNVENLFDRAKVMNLEDPKQGKPVLEAYAGLNALLAQPNYTAARKLRMVRLLGELGLLKSDTGPYTILRRNHGGLLRRTPQGGVEITAAGRDEWVGSLELIDQTVGLAAVRHTARVINEVNADVLAVVEAESRPALVAFNQQTIGAIGAPYRSVMVIDGNDERGIDVGLMTRPGYGIEQMRSHVDDLGADGTPIFRRDCPEYHLETPSGQSLVVLVNHFKSKGWGSAASSSRIRRAEAARVAEIVQHLGDTGHAHIAVVGDFNDTPGSDALAPLVKDTPLRDAFGHPAFDDGGHPGTYGLCNAGNKIDYLLLSPALLARVTAGGVFRKGLWPGSRPARWETFAELKTPVQAASDHAAVWVDLDL